MVPHVLGCAPRHLPADVEPAIYIWTMHACVHGDEAKFMVSYAWFIAAVRGNTNANTKYVPVAVDGVKADDGVLLLRCDSPARWMPGSR